MKRGLALSLILALALSLLTGCEMFAPDQMQTPNYAFGGGETGSPGEPEDSAGPAENVAGGVDEYGFTAFPAGNYLADRKFDTDGFLPDYDTDPTFTNSIFTTNYGICQTEDTIYTLDPFSGDTFSCLMTFTDKATGITAPLCGKPECLHNDENCNAYVDKHFSPGFGLCVYGGKIYWIDGQDNVARMNLDGTARETACRLQGNTLDNLNSGMVVFHRGYIYLTLPHRAIVNGKRENTITIKAYSMDSGEGFIVWEKPTDDAGGDCLIQLVGNELYIMSTYYGGEEDNERTIELYRWSIKTRQGELLYSDTQAPDGLYFGTDSFMPVQGDGIYFESGDRSVPEGSDRSRYINRYSFASGEVETVLTLAYDYFSTPHLSKEYIVTDHSERLDDDTYERTMYLYDYDGNLVLAKDLGGYAISSFIGTNDGYIYFLWIQTLSPLCEDIIVMPLDDSEVLAIPAARKTWIIANT